MNRVFYKFFLIFGSALFIHALIYIALRSTSILNIRYIDALPTISTNHSPSLANDINNIVFYPYIQLESLLIPHFDDSISPDEKHVITICHYDNLQFQVHIGFPNHQSRSFIAQYTFGENRGFWNVSETEAIQGLHKILETTSINSIKSDYKIYRLSRDWEFFRNKLIKNQYTIQVIGIFNGNNRRIFYNFINNNGIHSNLPDPIFYTGVDGGALYSRIEYEPMIDELYHFDIN
jgi:hypothetical protein